MVRTIGDDFVKTCKELALIWNVTERSDTKFCNEGKIPGAMKVGKSWAIPDDAKKPVDGRVSSGKYVKKRDNEEKKPLPIGISDYVRAQSEYYYVDKTLLIKDFLDRKPFEDKAIWKCGGEYCSHQELLTMERGIAVQGRQCLQIV